MPRLQHLELRVGEELLGDGYIVFVEVARVLALDEHGRAVPSDAAWCVGKIADLGYSAMQEVEGYAERQVARGGGAGVCEQELAGGEDLHARELVSQT